MEFVAGQTLSRWLTPRDGDGDGDEHKRRGWRAIVATLKLIAARVSVWRRAPLADPGQSAQARL